MFEVSMLYRKKEPFTLDGETPFLTNNLNCYLLSYDGLVLYNTQVPSFCLPVEKLNESDFVPVFRLSEVEHVPYSDHIADLDPADYWIDGRDVVVTSKNQSLQTYVYVRKGAKAVPSAELLRAYQNFKHYRKKFYDAKQTYERMLKKHRDLIPEGREPSEWLNSCLNQS